MGAGGPPRRAAGRVIASSRDALGRERSRGPEARGPATLSDAGGVAAFIEPDPLLRLHAVAAARLLGLAPAEAARGPGSRVAPAAVFVGLDRFEACSRCGSAAARPPAAPAPLVVGYATTGRELLAAHRLHACCDVVLELCAVAGKARFAYAPTGGLVEQARLTTREADVLVLILGGLSTAEVAERLCVSPATARTHCRALLRKFGAAERRALRARLLGEPPAASGHGAVESERGGLPSPQRELCGEIRRSRGPHTRP
jgi:DNA-binding CsgD family transcriptional regulator